MQRLNEELNWGRKESQGRIHLPFEDAGTGISCFIAFHFIVLSRSVMSNSLGPMTVVHQTPLSIGLSRKEYWSGLPFPPPGDLLSSGIEPASHVSLQANSLSTEPSEKSQPSSILCLRNTMIFINLKCMATLCK